MTRVCNVPCLLFAYAHTSCFASPSLLKQQKARGYNASITLENLGKIAWHFDNMHLCSTLKLHVIELQEDLRNFYKTMFK